MGQGGFLILFYFDSPVAIFFNWWGFWVSVLVFSDQAWLLASGIDAFFLFNNPFFSLHLNGRASVVPAPNVMIYVVFRFASRLYRPVGRSSNL
jgi:hypothetical protein